MALLNASQKQRGTDLYNHGIIKHKVSFKTQPKKQMKYSADYFNPHVVRCVRHLDTGTLELPGLFQTPSVEVAMSEVTEVTSKLEASGRPGLAARLADIAMMHKEVVEGTDYPPSPVIMHEEAARQIQAALTSAELPGDAGPVILFTHGQATLAALTLTHSLSEPVAA